jgi:hypothetical protein
MNFSKSTIILASVAFLSLTSIAGAASMPVSKLMKPTTTVFDVNGTFANNAVLSGSFDITLGQISSADMSISGINGTFTLDRGGEYNGNGVWADVDLTDGKNFLELDLVLAKGATNLDSYTGGALCDASGNCGKVASFFIPLNDRDPILTAGSVAPEPGATALLGLGLSALGLILRRRVTKN